MVNIAYCWQHRFFSFIFPGLSILLLTSWIFFFPCVMRLSHSQPQQNNWWMFLLKLGVLPSWLIAKSHLPLTFSLIGQSSAYILPFWVSLDSHLQSNWNVMAVTPLSNPFCLHHSFPLCYSEDRHKSFPFLFASLKVTLGTQPAPLPWT